MTSRRTSGLDRFLRDKPDEAALAQAAEVPRGVSFMLDPADIHHAEARWISQELLTHSLRGRLLMASLIGYLAAFILWCIIMQATLPLVLTIFLTLPAAAGWWLHKQSIRERLVNTRELREETTITLDPAGIVQEMRSGAARYPWEAVREVIVDDRQIYVRIDGFITERIDGPGGPLPSNGDHPERREVLIPRRAFLGSGHLEGFLIMIAAYRSGLRPQTEAAWPPKPR